MEIITLFHTSDENAFYRHIFDRAHWFANRNMARQQFKELAALKDTTSFPFRFTKDDIDAEVINALIMADAYSKPPASHYRYYYTTRNISGHKYRSYGTTTLHSFCVLYSVKSTWYGRDIVVQSLYPTTP